MGTKNFSVHLDHRFHAPNRPYRAMIQISNFGEDEVVSMFVCSHSQDSMRRQKHKSLYPNVQNFEF